MQIVRKCIYHKRQLLWRDLVVIICRLDYIRIGMIVTFRKKENQPLLHFSCIMLCLLSVALV